MLFVLVLEIEVTDRAARVFSSEPDARPFYEVAAKVCMDGPDDDTGPYVISNSWLWSVNTTDEDVARNMALSGSGQLIEVVFDS